MAEQQYGFGNIAPTVRGGRGVQLRELMKLHKVGNGSSEQTTLPPAVPSPEPNHSLNLGRGRASLLEILKKDVKLSQTTVPTSVGRGQASIIGLSKMISSAGSLQNVVPGSSNGTEVTRQMAALSITNSTSSTDSEPISRQGTSGERVRMTANYINLSFEPDRGVFEYDVRFSPEIDSLPLRRKLLYQHTAVLGGTKIFDGMILYLPIKWEHEQKIFQSEHPSTKTLVTVTVTLKRQRRFGEVIQLFNILLRSIMRHLELVNVGRHNYNVKDTYAIPQHRLELWPGYVSAIDEYEGGLKLCLDNNFKVMRTDTVRDLMQEILERRTGIPRERVERELLGQSVLTRYNNRQYRIDDISWDQSPLSEFTMKDNSKITYVQYYKEHWCIDILDKNQPLLLHRSSVREQGSESKKDMLVYLIPELCYLSGLTEAMRKDFRVMKDVATVTRVSPDRRREIIRRFVQQTKSNAIAQHLLTGWGLRMEDDTVDIEGRILPEESIKFGKNLSCKPNRGDWSKPMAEMHMLTCTNLKNWFIVHCSSDSKPTHDFREKLLKMAPGKGMNISQPRVIMIRDDRPESFLKALRENISSTVQLVVIIFPTNREDRYAAVKKLCCVEMPIASQVIIARTISRTDRLTSITDKIIAQINCKLGGTLWAVEIPMKNCMVCGVDVYHSGVGKELRRSVTGFVASLDKCCTRWFNKVFLQDPRQEFIDGLTLCLISALQAYYEENSHYPDHIIMYRDGVGDGQLNTVSAWEVKQLKLTFKEINPYYEPNLTVIICQKRINTRLFAKKGHRLDNPFPGTVVDSCVTRRNWYDFFLVSQEVRHGTVSPTHYIVVHDSADMLTDRVQRLTNKLCHLYYNWAGTIRVPAPCQYAHRLAYLVGQSIGMEPDASLAKLPFFL